MSVPVSGDSPVRHESADLNLVVLRRENARLKTDLDDARQNRDRLMTLLEVRTELRPSWWRGVFGGGTRGSEMIRLFLITLLLAFHVSIAVGQKAGPELEAAHKAMGRDDYAKAAELFRPLAQGGHTEAQFMLGMMYDRANGVPHDAAEAAKWIRLAADQGHAIAQMRLGRMYDEGRGVPRDHSEAIRWYIKAAEQGIAEASAMVAVGYELGQGLPRDMVKATEWFRVAAEGGLAEAQFKLGVLLCEGQGVTRDHSAAARWYRKAAEQRHVEAQSLLAIAYAEGTGVPQNTVHALSWAIVAATQGDKTATKLRELLRQHLAPERVAQAEDLSMEIWERIQPSK